MGKNHALNIKAENLKNNNKIMNNNISSNFKKNINFYNKLNYAQQNKYKSNSIVKLYLSSKWISDGYNKIFYRSLEYRSMNRNYFIKYDLKFLSLLHLSCCNFKLNFLIKMLLLVLHIKIICFFSFFCSIFV
ncbi:hypothetical protein EDEG_01117 [Edhazardia aedis USNM 41457]|uniref:Uncharacterized protein n=1 Tax=Edhazardia aedis (strain USNM 41457) TaxID=1003232 RepID=J9DAC5_EDHAE|nr:hypothetical protein EDEG_01117 [Edhazardia aedis USNM 41457]|eukprot:EJW04686.1 hypothetical protein EDEG_01117 [Edhazardia aedis USNM 41457]